MITIIAFITAGFALAEADSAAIDSDSPADASEVVVEVEGVIANEDESLVFDFQDTPLSEVVAAIAPLTGLNFMYVPESMQGRVTVISYSPIPREKVLAFLAELLETHDLFMYEVAGGELIHIAPAGAHPAPIVVAPERQSSNEDRKDSAREHEK